MSVNYFICIANMVEVTEKKLAQNLYYDNCYSTKFIVKL